MQESAQKKFSDEISDIPSRFKPKYTKYLSPSVQGDSSVPFIDLSASSSKSPPFEESDSRSTDTISLSELLCFGSRKPMLTRIHTLQPVPLEELNRIKEDEL